MKKKLLIAVLCAVLVGACALSGCKSANVPASSSTEPESTVLSSETAGSESSATPKTGRMTLAEAKEIIAECDDFEEVMDSLEARQTPDFVGGSGVTLIEYWLNRSGDEKISIILEQGQVYYEHVGADGSPIAELLYGHE